MHGSGHVAEDMLNPAANSGLFPVGLLLIFAQRTVLFRFLIYDATEEKVFSDRWGTPEFDAYMERFSSVSEMDAFTQIRDHLCCIQDVNDVQNVYITCVNAKEKTIIIWWTPLWRTPARPG